MKKRRTTNILLVILILLVATSFYFNNKKSKVTEVVQDQIPSQTEKKFDWKTLSKSEIESAVYKNEDVSSVTDLKISQALDLTGDGVLEGIVVGNGGNNDTYFILSRNSRGEINVLKEQEMDGSITLASLTSVSRIRNMAGFKLLPNENGFYSFSQSFDEEKNKWLCGGVYAYKWDASADLFIVDANLSDKYQAEGCKAPN